MLAVDLFKTNCRKFGVILKFPNSLNWYGGSLNARDFITKLRILMNQLTMANGFRKPSFPVQGNKSFVSRNDYDGAAVVDHCKANNAI
ncbi:hypothetical protein TNIN_473551 [Trichonephila inaurata madagascariensis]|uniref:Uncharacterized protein n=1 Tax=Trichonephila inaurata madagascariensis TaxID=2747483 RepID=A0A8X6YLQ5_9ARAC|nr:hypothetical protein TNIN_473551 [Trichonephila inaurata madagascariensis]